MASFFDHPFPRRISAAVGDTIRYLIGPERADLWQKAGWVALPFALSQFLRLGSNVVLAWLLAPQLLGVMLLINTLRTGAELLSDIGVGQSIVSHVRGADPEFYNTAWTLQILRGFVLFGFALAVSVPISYLYDDPQLQTLLVAMAPIFLMTGFTAPARFLLQKRLDVRAQSLVDLSLGIFGALVQIVLALIMPTIWALILGALIATAADMISSYFLMDWRTLRIRLERQSVSQILNFGKWIFLSSLSYFIATNFDRLYFAGALPFAVLGIYGISRTFSDTAMVLFARMSQLLLFPMIAATVHRGHELRQKLLPIRFALLLFVALALSLSIALADTLIYLVYDLRYHDAGIMTTILLFGTWFGILSAMADAIMMGIGRPSGVTFANSAKLLAIVTGLPIAFSGFGFVGCLIILVMAELLRYATLMFGIRRMGLGFSRQDIVLTTCFVLLVFLFRELTFVVGITSGLAGWVEQLEGLDV